VGTSDARDQIDALTRRFESLSQEFNRVLILSTDVATHRILQTVEHKYQEHDIDNICSWISPLDFGKYQEDVFARRQEGTGVWFLESPKFMEWRDGCLTLLWCPGIRGFSLHLK
jgi:hypothetical protein